MHRSPPMPNANNRSRPGINRSNLKSASPRAAPAAVAAPAPVVFLPQAPPPSVFGEFLQIFGGVSLLLLALAGLLMGLHLIRDSVSVGKHLTEAKSQRGVLVCQDGRMVRGDGSLRDLILADAYFSCTDWRTLQSIELEEKK